LVAEAFSGVWRSRRGMLSMSRWSMEMLKVSARRMRASADGVMRPAS